MMATKWTKPLRKCSIDGCEQKAKSRGWCKHHYLKWYKHGSAEVVLKSEMTLEERLVAKSQRMPNGCLEWTGDKTHYGYGRIGFGGEQHIVSRLAYVLRHGPIADDLYVCHRCDNPACFEDTHLFLGTCDDNRRDMIAKRRHNIGERHGMSKLTASEVMLIVADDRLHKEIAHDFGINPAYVSQLKSGKRWQHINAAR